MIGVEKMKAIFRKSTAFLLSLIIIVSLALDNKLVFAKTVKKIPRGKIISISSDRKGQMSLKWKKLKGVTGYRLKVSTDKKFSKGNKFIVVKSRKLNTLKLNGFKPGKTYYVKLRGYKEFKYNKKLKRVYGKYSKSKSVKIKKTNTEKYNPKKIGSIINSTNSLLRTLTLIKNDDGSGYTKYSYLDWSNFSSDLSDYKSKISTAEYMYKIVKNKKFKKAYSQNKKYTYKNIKNKSVTAPARKIYTDLYNLISKTKSNMNSSLNNLQRKSLSEIWDHYYETRVLLDDFKSSNFTDNMTDYEKVTVIYNYLCNKIYYEKDKPSKYGYDLWKADSTLYRVLSSEAEKSVAGVCGTYTCVFQMMCQYYGINSQVLCSKDHTWNTVKIDGIWYTCDLTIGDECGYGDDDITSNISKYFSKYFYTESEMSTSFKKEHSIQSILPDFYYFFIKPVQNFQLVKGGESIKSRFIKNK